MYSQLESPALETTGLREPSKFPKKPQSPATSNYGESNGKRGTSNGRTKGLSKQDTKDIHKINGEKVAWVESHPGVALCHTRARALSWKLRILF